MTPDTIFDLASLSKPGRLRHFADGPGRARQGSGSMKTGCYNLPALPRARKAALTVADLLLHRGGLFAGRCDGGLRRRPRRRPAEDLRGGAAIGSLGRAFAYSDVGYIVLGELVKAVDGRPLDQFAARGNLPALAMNDTGLQPAGKLAAAHRPHPGCARGTGMRGRGPRPASYALGGVAGHAGRLQQRWTTWASSAR